MTAYQYPESLVRKVEKRLRAQVEGNGIDPAALTLTVKRQGMGTFSARTIYEIAADVVIDEKPGRIQAGQIVQTGTLQAEIKGAQAALQSGKGAVDKHIKAVLNQKPLGGFGMDGVSIPLPNDAIVMTEQSPCPACAGKGQTICRRCSGERRIQCHRCSGIGELACIICNGRGQVDVNGKLQPCTQCHGRGRTYCPVCQGQRQLPCPECGATGFKQCPPCQGKAVISRTATLTPRAVTKAQFHLQELEDEPKRMASKAGVPALAKGGHITVQPAKPPNPEEDDHDRAWFEDAPKADTSGAFYTVSMPWAVAELTLNGEAFNVSVAGGKGAVAESGPFMDTVFKPFAAAMRRAANGPAAGVYGDLKAACKGRVSRETIAFVMKKPRKKALQALIKTYPLGLGAPVAKALVNDAHMAIRRLSRKPRYAGLAGGLLLAAGLYALWYAAGMRVEAPPVAGQPWTRYVPDGAVMAGGCLIAWLAVRYGTGLVMRSALNALGLGNAPKTVPTGLAGLWALAGAAAIWAGFFGFYIWL